MRHKWKEISKGLSECIKCKCRRDTGFGQTATYKTIGGSFHRSAPPCVETSNNLNTMSSEKKKVSAFEYLFMQACDPEKSKEYEPYTQAEELKQREDKLREQASKLFIDRKKLLGK